MQAEAKVINREKRFLKLPVFSGIPADGWIVCIIYFDLVEAVVSTFRSKDLDTCSVEDESGRGTTGVSVGITASRISARNE